MATFSEAQVTDLAEILETNSINLAERLNLYASSITESDKTKVLAKVATWQASAGDNFTSIRPKEANFGAEINPDKQKNQIKRQIAALILCDDLVSSGGMGGRLVRG